MENKQKIIIGIAVVIVAAGLFWYMKKKSGDLPDNGPQDEFTAADNRYYELAKSIVKKYDTNALSWANEHIAANYKSGSDEMKVKGRYSKTAAIVRTLGMMASNPSGKFFGKDEKPSLWPQQMFDELWERTLIPFQSEFGGL